MTRRIAPPLTDGQLADAERTLAARDRAALEKIEDDQEQEVLASAGDPEALAAREALAAGAGVGSLGRPVGDDDDPPPLRLPKAVKRNTSEAAAPKAKRPKLSDDAPVDEKFATDAYKLMDAAFRKWQKKSEKNPREAFRDLARDLGADTAIYLKAGVLRMSDMLDSLMKLTALGKPKEEETEGSGNFDEELDSLRASLRGGK